MGAGYSLIGRRAMRSRIRWEERRSRRDKNRGEKGRGEDMILNGLVEKAGSHFGVSTTEIKTPGVGQRPSRRGAVPSQRAVLNDKGNW